MLKSMRLVAQNRLIVRLLRVVTDSFKWPRKPGKTVVTAHRIGIVFRAKCRCQRQVGPCVPLILAIKGKAKEGKLQESLRRKGLRQLREINRRRRRIHTTL